jgi:hypothetical protein
MSGPWSGRRTITWTEVPPGGREYEAVADQKIHHRAQRYGDCVGQQIVHVSEADEQLHHNQIAGD